MAKLNKQDVIKAYAQKEGDTGSAEVQIALLSQRIANLTEHLKSNKQDKHALRGLKKMVGRRGSLLKYLEKENLESYRNIKEKLGL
jgi:small subunit ribosomal protein S15